MTEKKSAQVETGLSAPLISVIVPVYNTEKYLPHCIESILAQSYRHLEIILVDDGSPDRCGAICDEYARRDERIRVIHKENAGQATARNWALDVFSGDYVAFVDSDDFISPYFIEIMYNSLIEYDSDIASLRADSIVNFFDGTENDVQITKDMPDYIAMPATPADVIQQIFYGKVGTGLVNHLFKRQVFQQLRLPDGWIYEDTAVIHRAIMQAQHITVVVAPIYAYCVRMNSTMRMKFSEKKLVAIQVAEQVVSDARAYDASLLPAAASRAFALLYSVFMQVPASNREAMKKLWHSMLLYRDIVARNHSPQARTKDRIGAWCTYLGMNMCYLFGKMYRIAEKVRLRVLSGCLKPD